MARLIRVHAATSPAAIDRVRDRLVTAGVPLLAIRSCPGELVGDTLEVDVDDAVTVEEESAIRGMILDALVEPDPVPEVRVAERLDAIEETLRALVAALSDTGGTVQVSAMQEPATVSKT